MRISLRIPPKQEEALRETAKKTGKTKTAFILEAVNEKLGAAQSREKLVREMAGWLGAEEAASLEAEVSAA